MNEYLVAVFWLKRPLTRHYVKAHDEMEAIRIATSKASKCKCESYDRDKTKAMVI
ncbi:hypothetical protein NVP1214O_51 [Vibrio phage 1.214.O._10N.222.54.F11]|nr:hypothetical protein NVP1214O_51 [Vibrio phage 1.214.O._10N.222.54.F11]